MNSWKQNLLVVYFKYVLKDSFITDLNGQIYERHKKFQSFLFFVALNITNILLQLQVLETPARSTMANLYNSFRLYLMRWDVLK